jgi:hypothetical protein
MSFYFRFKDKGEISLTSALSNFKPRVILDILRGTDQLSEAR